MSDTRKSKRARDGFNEFDYSVGEGIEYLRNQQGLTQLDVAKHLGLSKAKYISEYERGIKPVKSEYIVKLASLFHCSTDYLLGLTDTPSLDINERTACDYTGLSPKAINELSELNCIVELSTSEKWQIKQALNKLLSDDDISSLYNLIFELDESINCSSLADTLSCEQSNFREIINNYSSNIDLAQFRLEKEFSKIINRVFGIDDAKKKLAENYIRIANEEINNG